MMKFLCCNCCKKLDYCYCLGMGKNKKQNKPTQPNQTKVNVETVWLKIYQLKCFFLGFKQNLKVKLKKN